MNVATLERKVRRIFGDEFDIVIEHQDIIDWINSAQVDVVRQTACLMLDHTAAANTFPVTIPDLFLIARVTYGTQGTPQIFTTLEQVDSDQLNFGAIPTGRPMYYYKRGLSVYLHPQPVSNDVQTVTVNYVKSPTELTTSSTLLEVPLIYHEDMVRYVLARAYEKNEDAQAQQMAEEQYNSSLAQRIYEGKHGDEAFPYVRPDIMDFI